VKISTREKRLLLLLLALAAIAGLRGLWRLAMPPTGGGVSAPVAARGGRGRTPAAGLPDEVVALRVDLLEAEPRPFSVGRDVFRFAPPPPPPGPSPEELERMRLAAEARRRAAEQAASVPAGPRPPAVDLRYLGSFGPEQGRIAVFVGAGGDEVINARVGDVIAGKFIVDRIGYESVDLKFVGFPAEPARRLPVGG
jgi:hypothetical protein